MARRIKITSGVLNIRLHPHTPERYAELLNDMYRLRKAAKMRGDRYGMISLLNRSEAGTGILTGVITTFVNIEFDGKWFDASGLKEATEDQISKVSIPENLHPNAASFYFYFDTKTHRMYFQNYSDGKILTPNAALSLFDGLSKDSAIAQKYGNVVVTLVQSHDTLKRMFALPVIKELAITIYKPNADIFADDFEEQIEAHLAQTHSQKVTIAYQAEPGQTIRPTPELQKLAATAMANGSVDVNGRDADGAVKISSEDQPEILRGKYDPEETGEHEAFMRLIPARRQGQ